MDPMHSQRRLTMGARNCCTAQRCRPWRYRDAGMRRALWTAAFVLIGVNGEARGAWTKVAPTDEGGVFYVDMDTIKANGPTREVWTLVNFPGIAANSGGITLSSMRMRVEVHCKEMKVRILNATAFSGRMATGDVVSDFTAEKDDDSSPSEPDGALKAALPAVCGK